MLGGAEAIEGETRMSDESWNPPVRPTLGRWLTGPWEGEEGTLVDVDVDGLLVRRPNGAEATGHPEAFVSSSGDSGDSLLAAVLTPPSWKTLFRGGIREALASAWSTAKIGFGDTNAWERPMDYVVDDGMGNTGVAHFLLGGGVVAAICDHESTRRFQPEEAIQRAPPDLRTPLAQVCSLPLLSGPHPISAVFWSEGDVLSGPEPWWRIYLQGARLFHSELLPPSMWVTSGAAHHDLPETVVSLVQRIAARAELGTPLLTLARAELRGLVPPGAPHEDQAHDVLFAGGLLALEGAP